MIAYMKLKNRAAELQYLPNSKPQYIHYVCMDLTYIATPKEVEIY